MNWTKVRKSSEIVLEGVQVDMDVVSGSTQSVTLTDAQGRKVRIRSLYGLETEVPAEPEKKIVSVIRGTAFEDIPLEVRVDGKTTDYEVKERVRTLTNRGLEDVTVVEESEDIPF